MNQKQLIHLALSQLTQSQEAKHYLNRYQKNDDLRFAIIKVGGGIIESHLPAFSESLALLYHLGLFPIIIHGAGCQMDQALTQAGVPFKKHNGLRVTDAEVLKTIRPVMAEVNATLVDALEQKGVAATGLVNGVFEGEMMDPEQLGFVAQAEHIHTALIEKAISKGRIPVLSCMGTTQTSQLVNINADAATRALVKHIKPSKTIFVTPTGGILDDKNKIIPAIQLKHDFDAMMKAPWLHSGMRLKLQEIKALIDEMDEHHTLSITSPKHLAKELFTHKGAGTFISQGERIQCIKQLDDASKNTLKAVLEHSFQRQLSNHFFDGLPLLSAYIAESERAMALITKGINGQPYLHKFAVTPEAQGEGLAGAMWRAIKQDHKQLYWRSRTNNAINAWYHKQADMCLKSPASTDQWQGFSYGMNPHDAVQCMVDSFSTKTGWLPQEPDHD